MNFEYDKERGKYVEVNQIEFGFSEENSKGYQSWATYSNEGELINSGTQNKNKQYI